MTNQAQTGVPASGAAEQKSSGCLKWGLIGCGILLLIGILTAVGCYIVGKKFIDEAPRFVLEQVEKQILAEFPADSPERARAKEALEKGFDGIEKGYISKEELAVMTEMFGNAGQDNTWSEAEIIEFTRYIEAASKDTGNAPKP